MGAAITLQNLEKPTIVFTIFAHFISSKWRAFFLTVLIHLFYVMTLSDRRPLLANVNNSINSSYKKMAFTDAEAEKGEAFFSNTSLLDGSSETAIDPESLWRVLPKCLQAMGQPRDSGSHVISCVCVCLCTHSIHVNIQGHKRVLACGDLRIGLSVVAQMLSLFWDKVNKLKQSIN